MRRRILVLLAAGFACGIGVTTAASAGGPSPGISGGKAGLEHGNLRYVTTPFHGSTSLRVIDRNTGRVLRQMTIKGVWGIPLVSFDGTAEGLLPGGKRILLAQPLFDGQTLRRNTTYSVVDVQKMKRVRTIALEGAFAFDAISPNGRYLYLIEYVSPEDISLYRVRAYDLKQNKLLAKIVADRRSWETGMRGSPVTRLWKGGWAYTLYGGDMKPFIHALDTRNVEAVCINMPWKTSPQRLFDFRMRIDGEGRLVVRGPNGRALAVIDRKTFRVVSFVAHP
jgi:DNA-binding beta-propeller fold protein YncE